MSEPTQIRVPLDNVNDDTVKLLSWAIKDGQEVRDGQLLAELETSKAVVEMIAPHAGNIWIKVPAGQEVPVGVVLAYITTNGAAAPAVPESMKATAPASPHAASFSKKALELLHTHGLAPELFAGKAMVREQDVKDYLAVHTSAKVNAASIHFALEGLSLQNVTVPDGLTIENRGLVDPKFLEQLRANATAFAALSSPEKCELYRQHGAEIGPGVALGKGSVLVAPRIILGEEAQFGENTSVICRERFVVGGWSSFRHNLNVRGGAVVLGESIFAGQNIRIGGGGNAEPWSLLAIGDGAYLGDDLFINICRPVVIGKEVFLTQRSILVTHNIGHSILEGYENRFAPIILEDYSQIGMNCTIYAGSTVGRYAIVGSNSYVISVIPAGKMAMGVPARVVRDAARPMDRPKQLQIVRSMLREYRQLLEHKGYQVSSLEQSPHSRFLVQHDGKTFQLLFVEAYPDSNVTMEPADETVVWTLDSPHSAETPGATVIDLLSKQISGPSGLFVDTTREFLRKRGIRFRPSPWRYRGGLF